MTQYALKPNLFEQIQITNTSTVTDIAPFFVDAGFNLLTDSGYGGYYVNSTGFTVVFQGPAGSGIKYLSGAFGSYLRKEVSTAGIISIGGPTGDLSTDTSFEAV
jgi:hypothetical protein